MANFTGQQNETLFALIGNIPGDYHSADLRRFFSDFIENEGFECFHFRHRPEGENPLTHNLDPNTHSDVQHTSSIKTSKTLTEPKKKTCCVVKLKNNMYRDLTQLYHKKHWTNIKGATIPSLCFVSKIKLADCAQGRHEDESSQYKTRGELREASTLSGDGQELSRADLMKLMELNPPPMMPNGNVGTPSSVFLDLIKACRLPPKIIGKLGLTFPKSGARRIYGNVKLDYGKIAGGRKATMTKVEQKSECSDVSQESSKDAAEGHVDGENISNICKDSEENGQAQNIPDLEKKDSEPESEEDADDCEEWERHEALHDDAANVERNKERVYEEELEVVWEKGGPGLVWYTDEKYWREQQGDFDEQTADDWDVDMSVYYEPHAGDRDARELVTMRRERRRRQGLPDHDDNISGKIGKFEQYTKGVGRKVLERQGWSEGQGLGADSSGISQALDNDGQKPTDKTGFGYYGEKLHRYDNVTSKSHRQRRRDNTDDFMISTVYDNTDAMETPETLLRRTDHNAMKYCKPRDWKLSEKD